MRPLSCAALFGETPAPVKHPTWNDIAAVTSDLRDVVGTWAGTLVLVTGGSIPGD